MRRRLGDVEWIDCKELAGDEYDGISVGLKHIGPGILNKWVLMRKKWDIAEKRRKKNDPDGYVEDYKMHLDGVEELSQLAREIMLDACVGVRGSGKESESDPVKIADEVDRLGLAQVLIAPAMRMQSLKQEDIFIKDPGNTEPPGPTESVPGSANP